MMKMSFFFLWIGFWLSRYLLMKMSIPERIYINCYFFPALIIFRISVIRRRVKAEHNVVFFRRIFWFMFLKFMLSLSSEGQISLSRRLQPIFKTVWGLLQGFHGSTHFRGPRLTVHPLMGSFLLPSRSLILLLGLPAVSTSDIVISKEMRGEYILLRRYLL
jgi:hypothetical protein